MGRLGTRSVTSRSTISALNLRFRKESPWLVQGYHHSYGPFKLLRTLFVFDFMMVINKLFFVAEREEERKRLLYLQGVTLCHCDACQDSASALRVVTGMSGLVFPVEKRKTVLVVSLFSL